MKILKYVKIVVFVISCIMFCHQMIIATNNLIDPPTVDSTYVRNITDDDMPLITVCPAKQINYTMLDDLEYHNVLTGWAWCNETTRCYSWVAHLNLMFDELTRQVYDWENYHIFGRDGEYFKDSLVFLPSYGFCKENFKLNATKELHLDYYYPVDARVFITDRNYRSYFMPDLSSHSGILFLMQNYINHYVNVKIQINPTA